MSNLRIRQNIFDLGSDWADPILWYARGVKAMKTRALAERTSWLFYAAIHGIFRQLWDFYGITNSADPAPNTADTNAYLDQCQHQSWYFVPWHRGYLLALENILRKEIQALGGPHETWALPYWNYFKSGQNILPTAFQSADWPDGVGDNPLFVEQRWGPMGGTQIFDITQVTNLDPMGDPEFTGPGGGGSTGFGGPETGFNWNGGSSGGLEMNPHNFVHGLVGGSHPSATFSNGTPLPGLMSDPRSAALDPIFYLHHCNIDRLWESWNKFPVGKPSVGPTDWMNPTVPKWRDGPVSIGERKFVMPKPDGSEWVYVPGEMQSIADLGYKYDDLTPGVVVTPITAATRMANLGIAAREAAVNGGAAMAASSKVELIGASENGMSLAGSSTQSTIIRTTPDTRVRVMESLAGESAQPDRVFINLENITGADDATIFRVFVGPEGTDDLSANNDYLAGSVSLFGVSLASDPEGKHAGNGISTTLEISKIVDKLHLEGKFDSDELSVQVVPFGNIPDTAKIKIGRISIYRQFD